MRPYTDKNKSNSKKKGVAVIKCFICNQMFYAQTAFDMHMKEHSNKLSRDMPEEIQRKTMQSFRVKKNADSKASIVGEKMTLNKTMKLVNPLKESKKENSSQKISESAENVALRESMVLLQKIELLTMEGQIEKQQQRNDLVKQKLKKQLPKLRQQEIGKMVVSGERVPIEIISNGIFSNPFLRSYQEQLQYLQELGEVGIEICESKVEDMKNKISITILEELKANYGNKSEGREKGSGGKGRKGGKGELEQNIEIGYCGECYSEIDYGQKCWKVGCGHKYHEECWSEQKECCK